MKKLAIIGASGHGKVIADIAVKNGYEEIVFLDDNPELKDVLDFQLREPQKMQQNIQIMILLLR